MQDNDQGDRTLAQECEAGNERAFEAIFERYGDKLIKVAGKRISERLASRIEAEDVVQSVFRTFFGRVQEHRFTFQHADDLWKLLVSMTLNKLRNKVDFHTAAKRDVDAEQPLGGGTSSFPSAFDPTGQEPSPEAVVAFLDLLENFMKDLRPQDRRILEYRLQGWTQDEIAREVCCTERTVRRVIDRIRVLAEDQNIREQLME